MLFFIKKSSLCWIAVIVLAFGLVQPALAQSGIDVVLHYVEGQAAAGQVAYDVVAYVSVSDSTGNPIKDLKSEDFALTEDSQKVDILSADLASNDPINLVLVLDTSGTMVGPGIAAAKAAADNFIAGLAAGDRVAIVTFDNSTRTIIDFTTDHNAARNELILVDAARGAGTCMYDAAYLAVQMIATVPSGRRAVILFTDGVDEKLGGGTCSVHTPEDVINLATEGGTRTPIYTLGMGVKVDQNALKRLAENTGGRFLYSPDSSQLDAIFSRLSDTLRSQYALRYTSTAGPGAHTLAVTAKYLSAQDTDTRNFLLPNFPLRLSFTEPAEGAQVSGKIILKAEASGQGQAIQSIVFKINDVTVGSDETSPYEAQVDLTSYPAGDLVINAIAQGADGTELARVSRTVKVGPATPATSTPTPTPTSTPAPPPKDKSRIAGIPLIFWLILLAGVGFFGVAILVIAFLLRRRQQHQRDLEWARQVGGVGEAATIEAAAPSPDRTIDAWEISPDAFGMLSITGSDDASMIGHRFEIMKPLTTLGRSADNEIPFPKDSPVSRHHAQIEARGGGLWISEVESTDKSGNPKRPTYGTFINENPISTTSVLLKSGDEIRLGKRVRLRFEAGQKLMSGSSETMDSFEPPDPDATQEMPR
jgi:VWFA-related protein